MARVPVTFTVNGAEQAEFVEAGTALVDILRERIRRDERIEKERLAAGLNGETGVAVMSKVHEE